MADRTVRINMSEICTVAEDCQGSSVMSANNSASNISANISEFVGTPFGVSFFAFTRFIGLAFYGFYYYFDLLKKCSSAYTVKNDIACAA